MAKVNSDNITNQIMSLTGLSSKDQRRVAFVVRQIRIDVRQLSQNLQDWHKAIGAGMAQATLYTKENVTQIYKQV